MRDPLLTTSTRRPLNSRLKFDPAQWACGSLARLRNRST
jgi:hypothetical protein